MDKMFQKIFVRKPWVEVNANNANTNKENGRAEVSHPPNVSTSSSLFQGED